MTTEQLPEPNILGWQALYQKGARAKCIKDHPPMHGFGRMLKTGDVVDVDGVTWRGKYEISVAAECAFYELEEYFEVLFPTTGMHRCARCDAEICDSCEPDGCRDPDCPELAA